VAVASPAPRARNKGLTAIVLALVLGVAIGGFFPAKQYPFAENLFHFLSKAFVSLIKGLVIPLLVSTIIVGVTQAKDLRAVGRMGAKALFYFEVVTTLALVLGLVVANVVRPGDGLPLNATATTAAISKPPSGWDLALHLFPSNLFKHAAEGDLLPIVVFSAIFGAALTRIGPKAEPAIKFFESIAQGMFAYTGFVMKLTPLGVFGAMAYNVSIMASGHGIDGGGYVQGWPAVAYLLARYAKLVGSLYGALFLLIVLVFLPILLLVRVPVLRFFKAIRTPLLTAYTTASSEAALPSLLENLIKFGVPRPVASFVIPTGYSFNLDGSTLYLVLASLTIAQAAHIEMSLSRQLMMLFTFMLTSKGVAGVPRATLVIIAGTSASFGLPGEAGVAMILAVDEVMDMARSFTNVCGNAIAAVVIAKWEGATTVGVIVDPDAEPQDILPSHDS